MLGASGRRPLRDRMLFALQSSSSMWNSLAEYPPWFVVLCATIVVAVLIWIFAKLVKVALWVLLAVVLVGGAATALWFVLR